MQHLIRTRISAGSTLLSRVFGFALVLSALSGRSFADFKLVPEMDAGLAMSAIALLGGGMAMIAGRRRRQ